MAEALIQLEKKDAQDRRMMADVVRRIGKALRQMKERIVVRATERIRGEFVWSAVPN